MKFLENLGIHVKNYTKVTLNKIIIHVNVEQEKSF